MLSSGNAPVNQNGLGLSGYDNRGSNFNGLGTYPDRDPLGRPMPALGLTQTKDVVLRDAEPDAELMDDAAFISVQDVHGFSVEPLLMPRSSPNLVAYATGPFVIVWDWKVRSRRGTHPTARCFFASDGVDV